MAEGKVLIGSYDQHLYALDAKTGALAWKAETEGPVHATAAVSSGLAFVTGCDERLRAIRIADGKQAYEIASGAYTGASPALAGGRAYYGTFDNQVLGVDLAERRIVWRYEHPVRKFPFYSSAALADGLAVLGGRDKIVHALDVEDRARSDGASPPRRASTRRPPSRGAGSTWAATTAASTCST